MIQPVTIDYNGEILSCRVHDMMLDLIIRKYSAEENFLTVVENNSQEMRIRGPTHNIRRLFHHSSDAGTGRRRTLRMPAVGIDLPKVRTFSTWGGSSRGHVPPVSKFRFLRVLTLEFLYTGEEEDKAIDLTAMCKLFQLRYIKIRSEVRLELPTQIRALQHLETLEISGATPVFRSGIGLPSDVAQLPCLSVLSILPHMSSLPRGIGTVKCLRSLASFVLEETSLDTVTGLRQLTNLKELYVRLPLDQGFDEAAEARVDILCSSLPEHGDCRLYVTAWSRWAWFPGVPQWIGRLQKLYSLELGVGELSRAGVAILAGLPALVRLDLSIRGAPMESTVITAAGFPALKHLIVTCRALCLTFEAGAMPSLQKLKLEFNAHGEQGGWCGNALAGIEHLPGLKEVYASIGGLGAPATNEDSGRTAAVSRLRDAIASEDSGRTAVVSRLRDAIALHPNRPRVDIMCTQGRYGLQ